MASRCQRPGPVEKGAALPRKSFQSKKFEKLRREAEELLKARILALPTGGGALPAANALRALHELSVNQIELEMQDEALRKALTEVDRLARMYAAQSQVNQAVIRCGTPERMQAKACEALVEFGKCEMAWIGWITPETNELGLGAQFGPRSRGPGALSPAEDNALLGLEAARTVLLEGRSHVVNHLPGAGLPAAAGAGLASAAYMPLRKGGAVRGILAVYAAEGDFFGAQERTLLEEVAETVSFALEHLEMEAQRRAAEASLAASEAQARTMLRTTLDGVWLLDGSGRFLEMNDAACRMLGYSREEMFGLGLADLEHAESPEAIRRHLEKVVREGSDLFESIHRRKDGSVFPVEVSVTFLPEQDRLVGFIRDISERKRWETALLEREQRYRTFFEYGPDGIVVLDPATARPIEFNDQACRQLGYTREEFSRLTMADIEALETKAETSRRIRAVLDTGMQDFETRQRTRQGGIRDVHVTAQHIQVGGVSTYHCVWRDITERKAAYEDLREANAKLCSLTLELTQTEQRERQRLAEVLHDHLQQQLVGATFNLETLRGQVRSRAERESLGKLTEAVRHAIDVSRDLTVELSPPVFHEKGLAGGLEWLGRQAERKYGLKVALDLAPNLGPDSEAIRTFIFGAVRELLLNVAKHAKVDQAELQLRAHGGGALEIKVADRGAGFDPGRLAAGAPPAQGFGLFSIRERLHFLGGELNIASAPGRGCTLTLVVPNRVPASGHLESGLPPGRSAP